MPNNTPSREGERLRQQPADGELQRVKRAAVRMLGPRARTRNDLQQRLQRRGFAPEHIGTALDALARAGYLDDAAFARERIQQLLRRSLLWGPALMHRLVSDGVDPELAEQMVAERLAGEDQRQWALQAAHAYLGQARTHNPRAAGNRLAAYLSRRGFDAEVVQSVVEEVLPEAP